MKGMERERGAQVCLHPTAAVTCEGGAADQGWWGEQRGCPRHQGGWPGTSRIREVPRPQRHHWEMLRAPGSSAAVPLLTVVSPSFEATLNLHLLL